MLLGLKNVNSTSAKKYQNKPRQKPSNLLKCAFDRLTRRYGNGDATGATFVGKERRYVLNVLTGFIQLMRNPVQSSIDVRSYLFATWVV